MTANAFISVIYYHINELHLFEYTLLFFGLYRFSVFIP